MKFSLTEFLIKKIDSSNNTVNSNNLKAKLDPDQMRIRFGFLEGWVSVIVNVILFLVKIILGIYTGSVSIIADAVHTVSDVATSGVVIWGFTISHKPADKDHPFGHGRIEDIATLIIAVLLCVVGVEILQSAFSRINNPVEVKTNFSIVFILVISVMVKEWLARFSFYLAKKIDSSILYADAWHHRSDAISTLLVIAAMIASMFGMFRLDSIFGAIVAAYVIYTGIKLIKISVFHLLGKALDDNLRKEIETIAYSVEGVQGVHDIAAHDYGTHKAISLHVEVFYKLDSVTAHQIAATVETRIAEKINSSPIVHIDLQKTKRKKKTVTFKILRKIIARYPRIINFHGVEILSNESGDFLTLHIVISKLMNIEQSHKLEHDLRNVLRKYFPKYKINIHVEPCGSECEKCPQDCQKINTKKQKK
ncbi:MAG: cation diffusion facilitator family transporter [Candidatus Omnitrophota bacterium]